MCTLRRFRILCFRTLSLRMLASCLVLLVIARFSTAQPTQQTPEELRLLTYNIHMWQPGVDALSDLIEQANADIVVLNEAWNAKQNDTLAKKTGYHIAYGGQQSAAASAQKPHWIDGHYMPQVLLTKHRIVSATFYNAKAAADDPTSPDVGLDVDPEIPLYRGGILAELETKRGNRLIVFALHLHPWGDAQNEKMTSMRLAEIEGIVAKLKPHAGKPTLLMGDFNTQSHLDGKQGWRVTPYLESQKFTDVYRAVHPEPSTDAGLTWPDSRIDYIFCNQYITPRQARVVEQGVFGSKGYDDSDHLALFAIVRLGK